MRFKQPIYLPPETAEALFRYLSEKPWKEVWPIQQFLLAQAEQARQQVEQPQTEEPAGDTQDA